MGLDPLSALGLAANIIQFVDFTSKLFSQSISIYHSTSGASVDTEEMIKIANHLQTLCARLSISRPEDPSLTSSSAADNGLRSLARDCKAAGDELLLVLHSLKATEPHKKWGSFSTALATIWKQPKIEAMWKRLEFYKSQLTLQLAHQVEAIHKYVQLLRT